MTREYVERLEADLQRAEPWRRWPWWLRRLLMIVGGVALLFLFIVNILPARAPSAAWVDEHVVPLAGYFLQDLGTPAQGRIFCEPRCSDHCAYVCTAGVAGRPVTLRCDPWPHWHCQQGD